MSRLQLTRSRYRVRATEDTVAEWKNLHKEAMQVRDYETVLTECLDLAALLHRQAAQFTSDFLSNAPDSLDLEDRLAVLEVSESGASILEKFIAQGKPFVRVNYEIERYAEAQECLGRLHKANAKLRRTCPAADLAAIDAAKDDVKLGRVLTFEEAFPDAPATAPA